jgi:homoserine/homoserine lactone efflux protein
MMSLQTLLLFTATELIFSIIPGPAVMLVSAHGFCGGFRTAMAATLGILIGNAVYIVLSALGLVAVLAASATIFLVVKTIGAAYLIFLGLRTIWHAGKEHNHTRPAARPFAQGVLTQLSNPKALLYFGAFLPQFLDPHKMLLPQYAEMFVIICIGETTILGAYGWLASRGARLANRRFAVWGDRVSGAILIAIGTIFAATRRA